MTWDEVLEIENSQVTWVVELISAPPRPPADLNLLF